MRVDLNLVNELATRPWPDAVRYLIDAPPNAATAGLSAETDDTVTWWTQQITAPGSGLHERMTFFWHNLLTTHRYALGKGQYVALQLNFLRANALGNFRTLLQGFVVDGALIRYLSADANSVEQPNENLARELMELFTVGIGHYGEGDVRAAARAMTGWRLDEDNVAVSFDPVRANSEPVTYLGETKNWDLASIVDRLCDHPATATRIAARLWYHLVGTEIVDDRAGELGYWWQTQNLEIKPLIERILNDPELRANHYVRPRSGFEFYTALQAITDFDPSETWRPRLLGQGLYEPPNVAGWPSGDRWLNPDSMLRRSGMVFSFDLANMEGGNTAGVDEILDRCGLFMVSQATIDAIDNAGADASLDEGSIAQLRWRIAMSSPEFQLI